METNRYRKKPVIIDAIQWTGHNFQKVLKFVEETEFENARKILAFHQNHLHIQTLEGTHLANEGDWIIRGVHQEYYPCKPDIFEETYERVEEGD